MINEVDQLRDRLEPYRYASRIWHTWSYESYACIWACVYIYIYLKTIIYIYIYDILLCIAIFCYIYINDTQWFASGMSHWRTSELILRLQQAWSTDDGRGPHWQCSGPAVIWWWWVGLEINGIVPLVSFWDWRSSIACESCTTSSQGPRPSAPECHLSIHECSRRSLHTVDPAWWTYSLAEVFEFTMCHHIQGHEVHWFPTTMNELFIFGFLKVQNCETCPNLWEGRRTVMTGQKQSKVVPCICGDPQRIAAAS